MAQGDEARAHSFDTLPVIMGHPFLEAVRIFLALQSLGVPDPRGGVVCRVLRVRTHHPCITTRSVKPAGKPLAPILTLVFGPVTEDLAEASIGKELRSLTHDLLADLITFHATVTVDVAHPR